MIDYIFTEIFSTLVGENKSKYILSKDDLSEKQKKKIIGKCKKEIGVFIEKTENEVIFYRTKKSKELAREIFC